VKIWRCSECYRCFGSEQAILDHQSLWSRLHAFDPEIDEHDGAPWSTEELKVWAWFPHSGHSGHVEFMGASTEGSGNYVYRAPLGAKMADFVGYIDEMHVPQTSIQLARAWIAAVALGIDTDEVSVEWHARWISQRWRDAERLAEERHLMLCMIGVVRAVRS
jgi:hypothetical protein